MSSVNNFLWLYRKTKRKGFNPSLGIYKDDESLFVFLRAYTRMEYAFNFGTR